MPFWQESHSSLSHHARQCRVAVHPVPDGFHFDRLIMVVPGGVSPGNSPFPLQLTGALWGRTLKLYISIEKQNKQKKYANSSFLIRLSAYEYAYFNKYLNMQIRFSDSTVIIRDHRYALRCGSDLPSELPKSPFDTFLFRFELSILPDTVVRCSRLVLSSLCPSPFPSTEDGI